MKYFTDLMGHEHNIDVLKRAVQEEKASHAYLFWGPSGIGKMAIALAFARHLIMRGDPEAELFFGDQVHPDMLILQKEENKTLIGIEQIVKNMEPWLAVKPYRTGHRVVLIRDAHLLSEPAANSLLKILEEPPPYGVIILVADEYRVKETIISRCQEVRFSPLPEHLVVQFLMAKEVQEETARRAAQLGQGRIGQARLFAMEEEFGVLWDKARQLVVDLEHDSYLPVFVGAEAMEKHPELICSILEVVLRDIMVFHLCEGTNQLLSADNLTLARNFNHIKPEKIIKALGELAKLKPLYRQNISSLLVSIQVAFAIREALRQH